MIIDLGAENIGRWEPAPGPFEELDRILGFYDGLPAIVDLTLNADGIILSTSDFPKLVRESIGLDLKKFFVDAFAAAEYLTPQEKDKLSAGLFGCLESVTAFVHDVNGVRLERSEVTAIELPPSMTHGFVQRLIVNRTLSFRLQAKSKDDVLFDRVSGIALEVCGKLNALTRLSLGAVNGRCLVLPVLTPNGCAREREKSVLSAMWTQAKELVAAVIIKLGRTSFELPVVQDEYRQCLHDAVVFQELLKDTNKDLVMYVERSAGIVVSDPLTRSFLTKGMRVVKNQNSLSLERAERSSCDLGGLSLQIAPRVQLKVVRDAATVKIEELSGIGLDVPFEAPPELAAIGLDLRRSLPKKIFSFSLTAKDEEDRHRLVVNTGPACWIALDVNDDMQPATDKQGNWIMVGVTSNPISGVPQKFFLRLDRSNNLNMTAREIAEVVTQTAIEGFDPADPFTWKWGAVALGGQALLAADDVLRGVTGDGEEVQQTARKFGRFIGKLLNEL